ncbi:cytochrome b [Mycobacterium montefiorense]|uniref:Type-b cytochrome (B561) n=1 Tax=Mycobacterium montefiorense TaxID=154654 RepID=A0AA37PPV1_9MYCO|nr:cytochrome b/b6 domain-containing protein [Mycobacterium montefiorense]GBG37711.1 putative type-b cytochrome (b561) [Mycobacterium montefiorense]GKU34849.1 putative type-b cytochrome (b561) [Mycobacterium montefiorense]GKU40862.1 putative type-b cytochrome (b561) [Mycobacterium montefiorense]GKU46970.1 putative type-b cytochrome (b561) [Mycobacterium montefiorense]GKU49090.1 putative type-b cytochrome (b561) [Mycobacterium montefiorense]
MTGDKIETADASTRFTLASRLLHWTMAPMVVVQLLIGVIMIASLSYYPLLLAIHRPLGVAILIFAIVRLANRLTHRPPAFLATMSRVERRIATCSEYALYGLLLVQPVIGWATLSAARLPVFLVGPVRLPGIAPVNVDLYALLRECHGVFAFLLFAAFTAHMCAVLFHTLVLKDRLIDRMALWPNRLRAARQGEAKIGS